MAHVADANFKVCTAQILHDNVVGLVVLTPVVYRDNSRLESAAAGLCLLLEAGSKGRIVWCTAALILMATVMTTNLVLSR